MRYLDTNILIYAIENHPEYGKQCANILKSIESGRVEACASVLVLVEVLNVLTRINRILRKEGKKQIDKRGAIEAIVSLPIVWFELSPAVVKKASEYDYSVSGADYIHIATMELNSISEIFSADEELDKVGFIRRIEP